MPEVVWTFLGCFGLSYIGSRLPEDSNLGAVMLLGGVLGMAACVAYVFIRGLASL
jgi:hypothetical protein